MSETVLLPVPTERRRPTTLDQFALIPEEKILLQKQKNARTRRAYRLDVQHFVRTLGITSVAELRQAGHAAVVAWELRHDSLRHRAVAPIARCAIRYLPTGRDCS